MICCSSHIERINLQNSDSNFFRIIFFLRRTHIISIKNIEHSPHSPQYIQLFKIELLKNEFSILFLFYELVD
ncbi:hypothetical protein FFZ99_03950 [Leptospira interrogans]|nr:hypothetical protein FF006_03730 [Leptospira interrogans]TQE64617.1 hypothetical protein FFZ99_03950 [Leptospira interrogans]TQE66592.1 hypothetical protein FF001_10550 [Leptospira interrogans]TQE74976.1 hypothetical protein FF002_04285 [Leptospira interrogans]